MKKNLVFVDAETDGLYGPFLSVGMLAVDEAGAEIERGYWGIKSENLQVREPWVTEHVLPHMGEYEPCEDEQELLEKVWKFWLKYEEDAYAVADVPYPVEYRLFQKCVEQDMEGRAMRAPFPLLDLESMLFARGVEPLKSRTELIEKVPEGVAHNAIFDAEVTKSVVEKIRKAGYCGRK